MAILSDDAAADRGVASPRTYGPPLIPEVGLLAMPYHHFSARWMGAHHVLTRLANYFHVLWIEPPHHWRETPSLRGRQEAIDALCVNLPPSFRVYVPHSWLPDIYRVTWLRGALMRARVRQAWWQLRRRGCRRFVLHAWHYQYEPALAAHLQDLSLYQVQDEYSFLSNPPPLDAQELRLIREVDQVFLCSPQLMERKGWINQHTTFAPNGVDYRLYSRVVPEPPDLAAIPHPRIGYTGNIKTQLDWRLLRDLAARHPEWSFVFVGARSFLKAEDRAILENMAQQKNVYFLGGKTVSALAAYPQYFDVCIMPYVINEYIQNIYPLKLHEYLAGGRPVVGSPIRSLMDFSHVVTLANTDAEWSDALSAALLPAASAPEVVARRRGIAQSYDWSELTFRIAQTICERLDPNLLKRIEKLTVDTPNIS